MKASVSFHSIHRVARRALLLGCALLATLPTLALAEYASIARSVDGEHWGWARKETQQLANRHALNGCNESAPKKDCRVKLWKAVARADGTSNTGFAYSAVSVEKAGTEALSACGERARDCKISKLFTTPGFIAVARTKNKDSDAHFFVAHAYGNSDEADKDAIEGCANNAKEECRLFWSGAIGGNMSTNNPNNGRVPLANREAPSCRPTTPTIRCSSKCTNGDCLITYENGCKMRVQVQPRFDPFTNQWTYPSPSC